MNKELQRHARYVLRNDLDLCSEGQQHLFKRMYAKGNLDLTIDEVIANMSEDNLDWAMQQVQRTVNKIDILPRLKS